MNKLLTIVMALVFSVVTNVKAEDHLVLKYTEPTGGKAEIRESKEKGLRFLLLNGSTPGEWKIKMVNNDITFLEGPFKDQKYNFVVVSAGVAELHEQGGRKTKWAKVKK